MQGKSGGIVLDVAHVEAEYQKYSIDELGGDRVERGAGGEGSYLCVYLPLGAEYGDMPVGWLSGSSAYHGSDKGTFHVKAFFCTDSGGARGDLASVPLQPVQYLHTRREATQAPEDETVWP